MHIIVGESIVSRYFVLSTDNNNNNNNQLGEINQIHPKRKILVILKFLKSNSKNQNKKKPHLKK